MFFQKCFINCFKKEQATENVASEKYNQAENCLNEAIAFHIERNYSSAVEYYTRGLNALDRAIAEETNADVKVVKMMVRNRHRKMFNTLNTETLNAAINEVTKKPILITKVIEVMENSRGHTYETLFADYLNNAVTVVYIEEPYLNSFHQFMNLVRFFGLLIRKCKLSTINLTTLNFKSEESLERFESLTEDLLTNYDITLNLKYMKIHDRFIRLNNGWEFILGRGLDIYQKADDDALIERFDFHLRKCKATKIVVKQW